MNHFNWSSDPERDYPTKGGENDSYFNVCCVCDEKYIGHKRSVACRKCHENGKNFWEGLTEEEAKLEMQSRIEIFNKMIKNDN